MTKVEIVLWVLVFRKLCYPDGKLPSDEYNFYWEWWDSLVTGLSVFGDPGQTFRDVVAHYGFLKFESQV